MHNEANRKARRRDSQRREEALNGDGKQQLDSQSEANGQTLACNGAAAEEEWSEVLAESAALVDELTGIGPKRANRLREAGITLASELAHLSERDSDRLAQKAGIQRAVLAAAIRDARRLLKVGSPPLTSSRSDVE